MSWDGSKYQKHYLKTGDLKSMADLAGKCSEAALRPYISGDRDEMGFPAPVSYKSEMTKAMEELAADPLVRFIGYGVRIGGRALGTLKNVSEHQLIEMPVAESLMVSFAIGLSLKGLKPVVFIERFDFIHNAKDAIVNHLDKMAVISRGEFRPTAILRIVVGNRQKPLFTGETHTQDYSAGLRKDVDFPVYQLFDPSQIVHEYRNALKNLTNHSTALVEYKDFY